MKEKKQVLVEVEDENIGNQQNQKPTCLLCSKTFESNEDLAKHAATPKHKKLLKEHKRKIRIEEAEKEGRILTEKELGIAPKTDFKCEICNRHFGNQKKLNGHINRYFSIVF